MTREELIELCKKAPDIGAVAHEEFVDYISVLDQVRRVNGQWEKTDAAYMSVDGKIAMANEDHRRQGKQLNFEDPVILVEDDQQLTLLVAVVSEVYGRRHGIATSRKVGGSPYETAHPWEVAETSAVGRALSIMGYGVLPGSGLASADDVSRAREAENGNQQESQQESQQIELEPRRFQPPRSNGAPRRGQRSVSAFQRQKIEELFAELYPGEDVAAGVDALFQREVGYPVEQATYDEGRQITAYLLREKRQRYTPSPDAIAT
ncbi:MAG: hypothetical protein M3220_13310 [Chloroflexota bacterium]|nr:hypothetical protein [Chloroflexota bacterium]